MRNLSLVCLMLSAVAWAQDKPGASVPNSHETTPKGEDVITIAGVCGNAPSGLKIVGTSKPCQTEVSRDAFEKLAGSIQPEMTTAGKRQLADQLSRMLVLANEAEKRGLDKQEHFQELLAYARLQILSQELVRQMEEESGRIPNEKVAEYYQKHQEAFEKASFERIFVPEAKESEPSNTGAGQKPEDLASLRRASEEEMAKEAEILRDRAARGEGFVPLQQAAYDAAGVRSPIPTTKYAGIRRAGLPTAHLRVFELKAGEVSAVISDERGHYIYKLLSKEEVSLEEAKPEIQTLLQKQRMREMLNAVQESATTKLNTSYFQPVPAPEPPTPSALAHPDSDEN